MCGLSFLAQPRESKFHTLSFNKQISSYRELNLCLHRNVLFSRLVLTLDGIEMDGISETGFTGLNLLPKMTTQLFDRVDGLEIKTFGWHLAI